MTLLAAASGNESFLFTVLIQLAVIMVVARAMAVLFRRFKQPAVIGEIAAGIVLGPSLFGHFFPELSAAIFQPSAFQVFEILSQLGLILLLFVVGLDFDFSHLRRHGGTAIGISLAGIVVPFALGAGFAPLMWSYLQPVAADGKSTLLGFTLFLGTAMAITAVPVLGRIMQELGLTQTRIGAVTIAAAAAGDACGWIVLATVSSIVQAEFQITQTLRLIGMTVAFALVMALVVRPLMKRFVRRAFQQDQGDLHANHLTVIYTVIFLCALGTSMIGIFAIFGAFLLGTMLSDEPQLREVMSRHLRTFLTVIFLPIFFTYTGLRTDIGTLNEPIHWLFFLAVIAIAIAGKLVGCGIAARLGGFTTRESICTGILMNTRGLMELIVVNLGKDLGVLPDSVFCMLVLMALITTLMTTPLLLHFMRGTELEPHIMRSGFLGGERMVLDEASLVEEGEGSPLA